MTDPNRTPDPIALALTLPPGCGLVYRAFGAADAMETARALRRIAERRGLMLLIGADARLAAGAGAHGVHLPERDLARATRLRARWPHWRLTGAAHGARALRTAALCGLDAALLSPAFSSVSPSAGRPLGPMRVARLAREARLPIYALGGITPVTARRLQGCGAVGLAGIGFASADTEL